MEGLKKGHQETPFYVWAAWAGVCFFASSVFEVIVVLRARGEEGFSAVLLVMTCSSLISGGKSTRLIPKAWVVLVTYTFLHSYWFHDKTPTELACYLFGAYSCSMESNAILAMRGIEGSRRAHAAAAKFRVIFSVAGVALLCYYFRATSTLAADPESLPAGAPLYSRLAWVLIAADAHVWRYHWLDITTGPGLASNMRIFALWLALGAGSLLGSGYAYNMHMNNSTAQAEGQATPTTIFTLAGLGRWVVEHGLWFVGLRFLDGLYESNTSGEPKHLLHLESFYNPETQLGLSERLGYLLVDGFRNELAEILLNCTVMPLAALGSKISPPYLRYYVHPSVVPGDELIDVGIAYRVQPRVPNDEKPAFVSLNVGHMVSGKAAGVGTEFVHIRRMTGLMLTSLAEDPEAAQKGFTGSVQAEFVSSDINGKQSLAQYNLSGWRDEESAQEWSKTNGPHAQTVKQYHAAELPSFSSVLMNLGPVGKGIRRHQRCLACGKLSYNLATETTQCGQCGAELQNQLQGGTEGKGADRTAATLPWF